MRKNCGEIMSVESLSVTIRQGQGRAHPLNLTCVWSRVTFDSNKELSDAKLFQIDPYIGDAGFLAMGASPGRSWLYQRHGFRLGSCNRSRRSDSNQKRADGGQLRGDELVHRQ